ncbi:MAG TPA: hypothetical protein VF088_17900 [Pyrinomonadaceae bacterium]
MKIISVLFVLVLLGTGTATAQWKKEGERKSVEGFGGHLLIIENPKAFIEEWQKPETPNIKPVSEAKRGDLLGGIVLFAGCKPDAQGNCNAEVDYAVYKPDGNLYAEEKGQPLWKEQAPPAPNIQLSTAVLGIRIEENDPAGEYVVKAKLSDLNAHISFQLETRFRVK